MKTVFILAVCAALSACATGTPLGDFQDRVSYGVQGAMSPANNAWSCYNSWGNKCGKPYGFNTSPVQ